MSKYQIWTTPYLTSDKPDKIKAEFNTLKDVSEFLGLTIPQVRYRISPLFDGKIGNTWQFSHQNGFYQITKKRSK